MGEKESDSWTLLFSSRTSGEKQSRRWQLLARKSKNIFRHISLFIFIFFFGFVLFAHFSWPSFVLLVKLEFLIKISVGRGSRLTWDIQASPRARCSSMAMDLSRNFHIFSPIFVYAWSLISWAWKIWLTQSDIYIMLTGGEWGESNSYFFSFLF